MDGLQQQIYKRLGNILHMAVSSINIHRKPRTQYEMTALCRNIYSKLRSCCLSHYLVILIHIGIDRAPNKLTQWKPSTYTVYSVRTLVNY